MQALFPKGSKLVNPKDTPLHYYVKLIGYIGYERLDFAMKEIVYELLGIDATATAAVNAATTANDENSNSSAASQGAATGDALGNSTSALAAAGSAASDRAGSNAAGSVAYRLSRDNLVLLPVRMEIGLRAFVLLADTLQHQREIGSPTPPLMLATFGGANEPPLSLYLPTTLQHQQHQQQQQQQQHPPRILLNEPLARDIGLAVNYLECVRRAFQDIVKTLDASIGRSFLLTRGAEGGSSSLTSSSALGSHMTHSSDAIKLGGGGDSCAASASEMMSVKSASAIVSSISSSLLLPSTSVGASGVDTSGVTTSNNNNNNTSSMSNSSGVVSAGGGVEHLHQQAVSHSSSLNSVSMLTNTSGVGSSMATTTSVLSKHLFSQLCKKKTHTLTHSQLHFYICHINTNTG